MYTPGGSPRAAVGSAVGPQQVGETGEGDHPVGIDEERGQDGALLGAAEIHDPLAVHHLERSKDPELRANARG